MFWNYFQAVREKWPTAWGNTGPGTVLPKTNGYRALMRAFKPLYVRLAKEKPVPSVASYREWLDKVTLKDADFTVDNFKPGTSGESELAQRMIGDMHLTPQQNLL